ncbi:unnamed protein product [Bursaphelenchus xylophilus]|uniref:(pine wood nematode) hypothetical protein n=1 Tax=Bursaphelenchus xylophilus TaxID=6326 RepID=A0A7I8X3M5_BURXY|nr:unnamed protein product [Bursaphelenchus xylophilus]CAG9128618.1 unnamed protein product [Bursaphelenchus xylophilus]
MTKEYGRSKSHGEKPKKEKGVASNDQILKFTAMPGTEIATSDPQDPVVDENSAKDVSEDSLNWVVDPPSPPGFAQIEELRRRYQPLLTPMHLSQFTDRVPHCFDEPVDYWIAWLDQHDCCGFVKNVEDATETIPLIMRFGGFWTDKAVKSMYLGCTVRVRGFYKVSAIGNAREFGPFVTRGQKKNNNLFAGIPTPSAFAFEWAVISKPKIIRSLGMVFEDNSFEKKGGLFLGGMVKDVEYDEQYFASPEKWPIPEMKKIPAPGSPVIINYVEITDPYVTFECKDKLILLPPYMRDEMDTGPRIEQGYLFAWLDLTMVPSRKYF